MELRPYQRAAVDATYNYLEYREGNPCIEIPTGGGKTAVMATMALDVAKHWGGRALILSHVKELIDQTASTLKAIEPELSVGVYSAGLKSRDTDNSVLCAGIQSVYKRPEELGAFDLVMVDEAHLIPPDGDGMYQTFLQSARELNSKVRLVGLTATPYRLKSGLICGPENLLNDISYRISVKELIRDGWLSHITSRSGSVKKDYSGLRIVRGDYDLSHIDDIIDDYLLSAVAEDIVHRAADRKSILVFCPSIDVLERFCKMYKRVSGEPAFAITGKTPDPERDDLVKRFKGIAEVNTLFGDKPEQIRVLANVNVLTTGFDAPNVDCIIMLRPTASPGLYYQQVGRGFRKCSGKTDCLILDYCGNIMRHGPVDILEPPDVQPAGDGQAPVKECPNCNTIIHAGFKTCPECGFEFPTRETSETLDSTPSDASILSSDEEPETATYQVFDTFYNIHEKDKDDGSVSRTIQIDYRVALSIFKSKWICPEHVGYAREKFVKWWDAHVCPELQSDRIDPPSTCEEFMDYANLECFASPTEIVVEYDPRFRKGKGTVVKELLGPIPTYNEIQKRIEELQNMPLDGNTAEEGYYNGYNEFNSYGDSYNANNYGGYY